ncbi:MAG: hypothetical protein VKJ64_09875 [Leptolyngbyaceae bacterium]|nr:hypothetical protein [Leptolyngbyaceae bacterium]
MRCWMRQRSPRLIYIPLNNPKKRAIAPYPLKKQPSDCALNQSKEWNERGAIVICLAY